MEYKWIGAHSNNFSGGRSGKAVNKIVMHWIVGTLASADAAFNNPLRKASAHYGVGPTEIHQYVKESDTAWHATNLTVNRESIGIEHEGGKLLPDGTREKPTEATLKNSAQLLADVCKRYNIPLDRSHVKIHKEYSATTCPGTLDVDRIIQLAKEVSIPTPMPITGQTKIPKDLLTSDNFKPNDDMEVQAIKSTLNDQARDLKAKDQKIKELEGLITAPFTKPKAIHFNELAKLEEQG